MFTELSEAFDDAHAYASVARQPVRQVWQQAGATAIGGCCGTDAAVIAALADQLSR